MDQFTRTSLHEPVYTDQCTRTSVHGVDGPVYTDQSTQTSLFPDYILSKLKESPYNRKKERVDVPQKQLEAGLKLQEVTKESWIYKIIYVSRL